jgi:hypothetical protein
MDWTTPLNSSAYHEANGLYYDRVGYGIDPENVFGPEYWKFDVRVRGFATGDWIQFKGVIIRESTKAFVSGLCKCANRHLCIFAQQSKESQLSTVLPNIRFRGSRTSFNLVRHLLPLKPTGQRSDTSARLSLG